MTEKNDFTFYGISPKLKVPFILVLKKNKGLQAQ